MKNLFFAVFFLSMTTIAFSQDVIVQKNGEKMEVKVTELADSYVKFYHFEDPDKVEISMNRSLIREIKFEYGRKETEVSPGLDESYYVDDNRNNILLNFTAIPSSTLMLSYERGIDPNSSFGGAIKIHGPGTANYDKSGFGIEGNYKVKMGSVFKKDQYRPNHLLQGFYVRPTVGFTSAKIEGESIYGDFDDYEYSYLYGGFNLGKQWVFNNKLSLDIFAGLMFYGGDYTVTENSCETCDYTNDIQDGNLAGYNNTAFNYGLQLGYTF